MKEQDLPMRSTLLPALLTMLVLGCKLDNPAFEGGDEFAEDQGTSGDEQDGSSTGESGDADQGTSESNTLDGSSTATTDDDPTTTNDDPTNDGSSTSDDATSTSTSTDSTSTTEDTSDTFSDTLDGPIMNCPITVLQDCKSCIQNMCCFEDGDLACIEGVDVKCGCVLDCLLDGGGMVDCSFCEADPLGEANANGLYTCALAQCEQWCP
jgi:hypothetical protein